MRRAFTNLTLDERRTIARLLQTKTPRTRIAEIHGRDRSTIRREITRHWWHDAEVPQADGYWHMSAQALAEARPTRRRKLERLSGLREAVINCLHAGWSPEQIAGRIRGEADIRTGWSLRRRAAVPWRVRAKNPDFWLPL